MRFCAPAIRYAPAPLTRWAGFCTQAGADERKLRTGPQLGPAAFPSTESSFTARTALAIYVGLFEGGCANLSGTVVQTLGQSNPRSFWSPGAGLPHLVPLHTQRLDISTDS